MNLRDMINDVLGQSGFLHKAGFANSTDTDDIQMVSIANRAALEIYQFYTWSALRVAAEITMTETAGVPDSLYPLPADFKSVISDSAWESDGSRQVELSTPERRWYAYKFSAFSDGGVLRARVVGNNIEVHDAAPGQSFWFEYISNGPIIPANSADPPKDRFTLDTDTWLLDDQVLVLGIQYNWADTKMLPQKESWKGNYYQKLNEAIARDVPSKTIGGLDVQFIARRAPYYPLYRAS